MIIGGIEQARAEICGLCKTVWEADATSADVLLVFEDFPQGPPRGATAGNPAAPVSWARVSLRPVESPQVAFARRQNGSGGRRYQTTGLLTWQIFVPRGDGLKRAHILGRIAQDGLRGAATSPGQIWFRRPRIVYVGPDGPWYQINVTADYVYDEVL